VEFTQLERAWSIVGYWDQEGSWKSARGVCIYKEAPNTHDTDASHLNTT
jgi:hypothetical protein